MKAKEVLKILNIARTTLYNYTKEGKIKVTQLDNGYYDEDSVYKLIKKDQRINVIYARVSTNKQKIDLEKQFLTIHQHCINNNIIIDKVYDDIHSGLDLDRPQFNKLIDDVINYKIKNIYISFKDRLTRLSFKTIQELFKKFRTNIITINQSRDNCNDNEIFKELISLIQIFSTIMYSNRRKNKINIYKNDIENYISVE